MPADGRPLRNDGRRLLRKKGRMIRIESSLQGSGLKGGVCVVMTYVIFETGGFFWHTNLST